jgi:hypothetical protein
VDFLVVYIVPEDTWFVIPVRAFTPPRSVPVDPQGTADGGGYERGPPLRGGCLSLKLWREFLERSIAKPVG